MLNDSGLQRVIDFLDDDLDVIAVGTGATPSRSARQLTEEVLRKTASETFIDGDVLIKELFLDETEANVTITEWGIFCNGASVVPGSGELFASTGANITKNDTQSLTLSVEIEVVEVA
ncbi:hypothetical protein COLU111180_12010 [Cohnella lubricantis]|uniref:Uncharacterized protein n=1 Tax=Cohnella lubricantis TaxID=2163172 RepID=A0A841T3R1_9BACL|nr:hypothetical protein [Cohnella lubricantis]MBB6675974.1 hypothetical protein [Cohnella lubricantis]MBP2117907.1 hypothetical protein [Cohnella lubricantis]